MLTKQLFAPLLVLALISANPLANAGTLDKTPKKTVAKPATYTVDPAQSTLTWNAKKVGGEHTGTIKLSKGDLVLDGNKLVGGTFVADMTTIADNDNSQRLVGHLKNDDFFGVEKNPTSTFKITKVTPLKGKAGEPNYTVTGDLMIKGKTSPITFPATVKVSGDGAEAMAKIEVNRVTYDIKYRAAVIGTAADKIIEDNFTLDLKLVAKKSAM
ncbi:YceI family protein [Tellurirhabdus bombi]|uniref:YceI family protein n=1 Tax=Tellurirhabdus bombi TaxID=2907205 RepID=UPI001F39AC2D|nr:YceI family protein [Tellurirhabdus bombi]